MNISYIKNVLFFFSSKETSMNFKFKMFSIVIIIALSFSTIIANDMILTLDDGEDVVLHPDSTWGYTKFTITEGDEEDKYITIDDGRTIWLKTDNTWTFTDKKPPVKPSKKDLPSVFANGSATKPALDMAVQSATEEAINRLVNQLIKYVKKSPKSKKFLEACIKHEIGDTGAEVTYKPKWTAQAKISLDKLQVRNIVECVQTQIDSQNNNSETK